MHTHSRYPEYRRDEAYTRSYRVIRLVAGFLGVVLPVLLVIGEAPLAGGVHILPSLSAYYHTAMRDVFVGVLCVIGVLLGTYMAGEPATWDFWASLIAGVAVLGVVFFPAARPGLQPGTSPCGSLPQPPGCSFVQQALGEHQTSVIHGACAIVFIFFLAVMSFLFAASEVRSRAERPGQSAPRLLRSPALFAIHSACALVILAAGAWAFLGTGFWELTRLYIGEVASVWAFGISWLLAGFYLTAPARSGTPVRRERECRQRTVA